jgi:hypothetical protein
MNRRGTCTLRCGRPNSQPEVRPAGTSASLDQATGLRSLRQGFESPRARPAVTRGSCSIWTPSSGASWSSSCRLPEPGSMDPRSLSPQPDQTDSDPGTEHEPAEREKNPEQVRRDQPSDPDDEASNDRKSSPDGHEGVEGGWGSWIPVRARRRSRVRVRCRRESRRRWGVLGASAEGWCDDGSPSTGPSWTYRADVARPTPGGNTLIIVRPVIPPVVRP